MNRQAVIEKLHALGISPKLSLGQNFLTSDYIVDAVVGRARRLRDECAIASIVEIGPGLGALTSFLGQIGIPLHLLELDSVFAEHWRRQGLPVLEGDALKVDWADLHARPPILLVSNLPYQIAASVVVERSFFPAGVAAMVLMFQKEVAQRMRAKAKSADYGLLSVVAQTFWSIEVVADASPRDFYPAPKVASQVLAFSRKHGMDGADKGFLTFLKAAFAHRRKLLLNGLKSYSKADWPALFASQGLSANARAQELDSEQLLRLYRQWKQTYGKK